MGVCVLTFVAYLDLDLFILMFVPSLLCVCALSLSGNCVTKSPLQADNIYISVSCLQLVPAVWKWPEN